MDEKITILEACKILHRSEKQVRRYVTTGRLPAEIGEDGKYHILRSDTENLARHPDRIRVDKVSRQIEDLEERIDELAKKLDIVTTRLDELVQTRAESPPGPPTAQPPPTPHSEQAKPSVPHSDAIAGLPADSIHIQDFLSLHHLKEHRRKIIGYMDAPRNGLKFHAVPKLNREGETDRYLDPLQQDTLLAWLHVHHPEVFTDEQEF